MKKLETPKGSELYEMDDMDSNGFNAKTTITLDKITPNSEVNESMHGDSNSETEILGGHWAAGIRIKKTFDVETAQSGK